MQLDAKRDCVRKGYMIWGGGAATMEMQFHIHSQKVKALTEFHALAHQKKVGVAKWALFNAAWKGVQEAEISG